MKVFAFGIALAALASIVSAAPQLSKRASTSEAANAGYAKYAGTTGGIGGPITTVNTLAALTAAVASDSSKIVIISGTISGNVVVPVGSNTSILGANSASTLLGVGLRVLGKTNVIIRNLKIQKVLAETGDAIGIQSASKVWVDHCDLSSDMDHSKDYYDGLLDITHAVDGVTVSYTKFHDHYKGSLVGHSDNNAAEDKGHLTVSYTRNWFYNINSRTPSYRFGNGHIWNNYFSNNGDGINTRMGAKLLVQNNYFENCKKDKSLYSTDAGYAQESGNVVSPAGSLGDFLTTTVTVPYTGYTLVAAADARSDIIANSGNTLTFP